mmetsp:Transcript_24401/g.69973  ORF Transcript_24401/g.69973 Transcript_24401/m.69973 type:complete len:248 (+) Transcript_24401:592-1335(+)
MDTPLPRSHSISVMSRPPLIARSAVQSAATQQTQRECPFKTFLEAPQLKSQRFRVWSKLPLMARLEGQSAQTHRTRSVWPRRYWRGSRRSRSQCIKHLSLPPLRARWASQSTATHNTESECPLSLATHFPCWTMSRKRNVQSEPPLSVWPAVQSTTMQRTAPACGLSSRMALPNTRSQIRRVPSRAALMARYECQSIATLCTPAACRPTSKRSAPFRRFHSRTPPPSSPPRPTCVSQSTARQRRPAM